MQGNTTSRTLQLFHAGTSCDTCLSKFINLTIDLQNLVIKQSQTVWIHSASVGQPLVESSMKSIGSPPIRIMKEHKVDAYDIRTHIFYLIFKLL